jgi:hypothetical protein
MRDTPPIAGAWVWLFPATMIIHVAEEALTGETFPRWISRVTGVDLAFGEFLALNAIAFSVIVTGTVLALRLQRGGWALAALGTAVVANALLHLGGTALTRSWSPGVASATLLWLPLGAYALHWTWRHAPRVDLAIGLVIGFFAHGLVSLSLALS